MALRRQSVEVVFGHLKDQLGFSRFILLGISKVKAEYAIFCSAFNFNKLYKYLTFYGKTGSLSPLERRPSKDAPLLYIPPQPEQLWEEKIIVQPDKSMVGSAPHRA